LILEPQGDGKYKELARYGGRIIDQGEFVDFLEKPLDANLGRSRTAGLSWSGNIENGLKNAQSAKKQVFVNFTSTFNAYCARNEHFVFTKPEISNLLEKYELVELYIDVVPTRLAQLGQNAKKNLELLQNKFQASWVPFYVILDPLPDGGIKEVDRYEPGSGAIDVPAFRQFLNNSIANKKIARN